MTTKIETAINNLENRVEDLEKKVACKEEEKDSLVGIINFTLLCGVIGAVIIWIILGVLYYLVYVKPEKDANEAIKERQREEEISEKFKDVACFNIDIDEYRFISVNI